ncbi:hypothetical protein E4K73_31345 [Streptomyces sp. IB201691-2A2]|nr:hypothetical protein E4K73_31345 [Streptomyces sp. IB201691-2A2]
MDDHEEFTYALKAVLRDLRAQCPVQPDIRKHGDEPKPGHALRGTRSGSAPRPATPRPASANCPRPIPVRA